MRKKSAIRLLVCGDRHWDDIKRIKRHLMIINNDIGISVLIQGGQKSIYQGSWGEESFRKMPDGNYQRGFGADYQAKVAAIQLGIPVMEFAANWEYYHKAAGPIRNGWMLKFGQPDLVLAFHSDLKHSKGTKDMVNKAKKAGVKVQVIS